MKSKKTKLPVTFSLCCGKGKCPVVTIKEENDVVITDDFGGSVKMTGKQFRLLLLTKWEEIFKNKC